MKRIDLQLFAQKLNTKTSVVDLLKSQGKDSSMEARKELADSLGIGGGNYSGTYEENVALLKALQGGSQKQTTPKATATPTNTNVAGSAIHGVDQALLDKMNSTFTASSDVTNAMAEKDTYLNKVKEMASVEDIISQDTWDAINTKFSASTAYQDAMKYTNQLLQQLSSGRTSYTDQIKDLMGQIQNREDFEYDVDSDVLFQQYLGSAMNTGKQAMMDTMGQASALTGGYGSTYATSAANQQYNAYIQDAYNNLPEYYQMALEAYQMEGEEMYNQLAMLNQADMTEYQRLYDSWNANFSNAQNMYQNEYNTWRDGVSNAISSAGLQLNEYGQLYDQAYKAYTAVADNAQTMYQNEYNKWADEVNNAYKMAQMSNSDYWANENFIEEQRQFNLNYEQRAEEFRQEMEYKNNALAQDQSQFEASLLAKSTPVSDPVTDDNGNLTGDYSLSTTEINGVKDAYRNAGGGQKGYEAVDAYLKGIGKYQENEGFQSMIDSYIESADAQKGLPSWYQTWNMTNDTKNWFDGDDRNDEYTNLNGDSLKYKELKKELKNSGLTDEEIEAFLTALQAQSKR